MKNYVLIRLRWRGEIIIIPQFMDSIQYTRGAEPQIHNIIGRGGVATPSFRPPLIAYLENAIFWREGIRKYVNSNLTPKGYVVKLNQIRASMEPCHLTIESDNLNYDLDMQVLIDFESWQLDETEQNVRYSLYFYEFREHKVKEITASATSATSSTTAPVEHPTNPPPLQQPRPQTYTVKSGDSLNAITQRYTGSSARWRELYDMPENKAVIHQRATSAHQGNLIFPGQVLTIPNSWL